MPAEQNFSLSEQQIEIFFDEGYLIIQNHFKEEEIKIIADKANALIGVAEELAQHSSGKVMSKGTQFVIDKVNNTVQISRIVWAGAAEPELLKISRQDKLLLPIAQLLNSNEADHLINQLHYKLPHDGVHFTWHQDIYHRLNYDENWQDLNGKGSFVQSFIAIDRMTVKNGAIFIVTMSNKYGAIPRQDLEKQINFNSAIPLLLNPGDLVFIHPYLVHGSFPNESEESRLLLVNGFSYPGANIKKYPGIGSAERIHLIEELPGECFVKADDELITSYLTGW